MQVTDSIRYVGVNDHQVDLFEGQYRVSNGMSYNSYVILDEKIAVMDTVDIHFGEEWMANVKAVLAGRTPDYLIVQHMEPDHSANISRFLEEYPQATVVATAKAFVMMKQFFGNDYADRRIVASEMSELSLGAHTLHFVMALWCIGQRLWLHMRAVRRYCFQLMALESLAHSTVMSRGMMMQDATILVL